MDQSSTPHLLGILYDFLGGEGMGVEPLESVDPRQLYGIVAELQRVADNLARERAEPIGPSPPLSAEWVRTLIGLRQLRREYLGAELFFDPAWDMLLDLFASRLAGRRVTVTSLCIAAGVASTTALRWMKSLEAKGFILRHRDPGDRRRVYVELSDEVAVMVGRVLTAAQMQSVALV
ncbi:MAG TPA: MarR family transcriptional regulator [Allosphingosinicella sp.]|jgi:hypothetical protein